MQSLQHAKDPSGGQFDPPMPKPLDPYTETNTTEKTAPNFQTKDPSDCDKRYDDDVDACKDTCGPLSVSRYWCIVKALAKYRACRRIYNPAGSDWTK